MPDDQGPILTVVIVTFNSIEEIGACLRSIALGAAHTAHEIIVVDNASTDGTADAIATIYPHVDLIRSPHNLGFGAACNVGARTAQGDDVLFFNPDAQALPGALDRLVAVLAQRPDVVAVGPRIVDAQGRAELSFGPMLSPLAELRQKALVRGHGARLPVVSAYVERLTRQPRFVDWVTGACLLVRRHAALTSGLFDERFFMYKEDVDLCATLRSTGGRIQFEPTGVVRHARGRSGQSRPTVTADAYRRSQLAFYSKHYPRWVPLVRLYLRLLGRLPRPQVVSPG